MYIYHTFSIFASSEADNTFDIWTVIDLLLDQLLLRNWRRRWIQCQTDIFGSDTIIVCQIVKITSKICAWNFFEIVFDFLFENIFQNVPSMSVLSSTQVFPTFLWVGGQTHCNHWLKTIIGSSQWHLLLFIGFDKNFIFTGLAATY